MAEIFRRHMDHDHDHYDFDERAHHTLSRIESGGRHLLTITRRNIGEALEQLDAGDFREAANSLGEAMGVLGNLAHAQTYMAVAEGSELKRIAELEPGMVLVDVGEVSAIEIESCAALRCPGHAKLTGGEHEMNFKADQEVYVLLVEAGE